MNKLLRLKESMETPLYNLWRVGMVVPFCFAVSFFIIYHMIFHGEDINRRSWIAVASGAVVAVFSLAASRRLPLGQKLLYILITVIVYPLLFVVAMLGAAFLDLFHCGLAGTQ